MEKRSFTLISVNNKSVGTRGKYISRSPAGAASKAGNSVCKNSGPCSLKLSIQETTPGRPQKTFSYTVEQSVVNKVVEHNGKKVVHKYETVVKKDYSRPQLGGRTTDQLLGCPAGEIPEEPIAENYHMYRQVENGMLMPVNYGANHTKSFYDDNGTIYLFDLFNDQACYYFACNNENTADRIRQRLPFRWDDDEWDNLNEDED